MSNAVRDLEKLHSRQVETTKRRQTRELKNLENAHDALKTEIKKAHTSEVIDLQDTNHRQLDSEAMKKEKVLADLRTNLQQTQSLTDKQLKNLQTNSEKTKKEISEKLVYDRERILGENELYLQELNDRFNQEAKEVHRDGKSRVEDMKSSKASQYSDTASHNSKKLNDQTNQFSTRFQQEGLNYKKIKDDQVNQFKKERMSTNVRQQIEMGKMTEAHVQTVEQKDDLYRKGLKDQDLFFEKKYKVHLDKNNEDLKKLEDHHKRITSQMKTNLTEEISKVSDKAQDPFFQFGSLKPTLKQFPDRVEVSVEIPEHSKADVQLTTNIKEAIVTLNRRYSDANRTPEGVINKVNKVESFVTRLPTDGVLDPKNIKSSYESGVMTYVIKKA